MNSKGTDSLNYVVYLVTNTVSGKKYVGCTERGLKKRWSEHLRLSRNGSSSALHAAIRKYGPDFFTLKVLEIVPGSHTDLMASEVRWITFHACVAPYGYNLTRGGDGVDFTVPAVREKHLRSIHGVDKDKRSEIARLRYYSDPTLMKENVERNRRLATDPEWLSANAAGLAKTRNSAHTNALARDAQFPLEVQAKRAASRVYALKSYHKLKTERTVKL